MKGEIRGRIRRSVFTSGNSSPAINVTGQVGRCGGSAMATGYSAVRAGGVVEEYRWRQDRRADLSGPRFNAGGRGSHECQRIHVSYQARWAAPRSLSTSGRTESSQSGRDVRVLLQFTKPYGVTITYR